MSTRRSPLLIACTIGLAVGIAYPFADRWLACRVPVSEACVWGKAYFPLTLGVSIVLLGGITAGILYAVLRRRGSS